MICDICHLQCCRHCPSLPGKLKFRDMEFGKYHFHCRFTSKAQLPPFKGSTFRGVFGRALKRVVCALKLKECGECPIRETCLYVQVFEIRSLPHPFVIEPPLSEQTEFAPGDTFDFHLLLFGKMNRNIPYFVYAFKEMGKVGIGRRVNGERGQFSLEVVECPDKIVYEAGTNKITIPEVQKLTLQTAFHYTEKSEKARIHLLTPLRIKHRNRLSPELPFHVLIRAVLRRLSSLWRAYGDGDPPLDYSGLVRAAERVKTIKSDISWFDWRRYSFRQDRDMLLGGLVGSVVYEGDLAPYVPFLRLCQEVHIGKQTTFGLGKISVETTG